MKVILDTNVFISAFIFGGKIEKIIKLFWEGEFDLVSCQELLDEVSDKLINKFKINEGQFELVLDIFSISKQYELSQIQKHSRDSKDDFLVELALISNSDYLVSGDKDLLVLEKVGNCKIISPTEFLII